MLKKFVLALFGFLFAFGMGELAVRLLPKPKRPNPMAERPHIYNLPSRATSPHGNLPLAESETYRIAVVGDSFTFGPKMQFDDTFSARLQRMLNLSDPQPPVEVVNMGTSGFSTFHEVDEVRRAIEQKANLVVLEVTLNDPQREPMARTPKEFALEDWEEAYGPVGRLLGRSALCNLVRQRIHNTLSIRKYIDYHQQLWADDDTWILFRDSVKQIQASASAAGVKLGIVLFPLLDFPLDQKYPFANIHQKVAELARQLNVPFLDLFKAFQGLDPQRLQLLPGRDSHPNEIGHRIAAEALYRWLEHDRLVPENSFISYRCKIREGMKAPPSAWRCRRRGDEAKVQQDFDELGTGE